MQEPRKFKHWAYLNEEGKKLYGHIYPNGEVPVVSMIPTVCEIAGHPERVYMIYHEELEPTQFELFINELAGRFHEKPEVIKKAISTGKFEDRIPIREKFIRGSGTDHPGLFI